MSARYSIAVRCECKLSKVRTSTSVELLLSHKTVYCNK